MIDAANCLASGDVRELGRGDRTEAPVIAPLSDGRIMARAGIMRTAQSSKAPDSTARQGMRSGFVFTS
jgi:hypothetical protein